MEDGVVGAGIQKGDPKRVENYRSVTLLVVASKVLERVILERVRGQGGEEQGNLGGISGGEVVRGTHFRAEEGARGEEGKVEADGGGGSGLCIGVRHDGPGGTVPGAGG